MNKSIIASALAVTMGAGLVGSISGTVAWYQYSTRATIQMIGLSLGTEKALEIAVAANQPAADSDAWKTESKTVDGYIQQLCQYHGQYGVHSCNSGSNTRNSGAV